MTLRSKDERGADPRAGKPEHSRKVGGGTAESTDCERQASAARSAETGDGAPGLIEEVLGRENVMWVEAELYTTEICKRANEETSAYQKNHAHSNFGDDQQATHPLGLTTCNRPSTALM